MGTNIALFIHSNNFLFQVFHRKPDNGFHYRETFKLPINTHKKNIEDSVVRLGYVILSQPHQLHRKQRLCLRVRTPAAQDPLVTGAREACTLSQGRGSTLPPTQCLQLSERGSHLCLLGTRCVSRGEGWDGGHQGRLPGGGSQWAAPDWMGTLPVEEAGWEVDSRVRGERAGRSSPSLCRHSGRNPSWSRCKDGVTHPAGTAYRKGKALHRSSEWHPQTHLQL